MSIACLWLSSCQRRQRPAAPSKDIKITDLIPPENLQKPSQVNLTVFTYEMPAKNASIVTDVYKSLPKNFFKFASINAFKANGFEAGFGQDAIWKQLGDSLGLAMARKSKTDNLLFMDRSTNELVTGRSYHGQKFYLHKRSGSIEPITLKNGQFFWRVKARAMAERKGVALVQIQILQKEIGTLTSKKLPGFKTGENIYYDMGIRLNMSPGDFVVIGPSAEENPQITLGDLYFQRHGDIIIPKIEDTDARDNNGQPFYKIEKNIPLTRVYVFACMGVEN